MQAPLTIVEWFSQRLPSDWFTAAPDVGFDGDEILVVGTLPEVPEAAGEAGLAEAARAFRERTREQRMALAEESQALFKRRVSWGVEIGAERVLFTTVSVPVMTRLRLAERTVLDTLVEAGVARSRSDALAWCVRLVGRHESDWLAELRDALVHVQKVRTEGPNKA